MNMAYDVPKEKEPSVPLMYADHEDSGAIARALIVRYHSHLASAKIKWLCRNKSAKSGGKQLPGQVKKASPIERHLADEEYDFIITVALDVWNNLTAEKKTALIDHLLSRCSASENPNTGDVKYRVQPPQVQEFPDVALRHGAWNEDLQALGSVINRTR